jgi:poly-beta-hydroxybutyrate-responsive repressor
VLLLVAEAPSHGYDLLERLSTIGVLGADAGGLYRMLRTMEQGGLLESKWETSTAGPARRIYRITEDGMDWLHAWAGAHRETIRIVRSFLARYEAVTADPGDRSTTG